MFFFIEIFITVNGQGQFLPEGPGGGKGYRGHFVASTLRREAPLREPGVPPTTDIARLRRYHSNSNSVQYSLYSRYKHVVAFYVSIYVIWRSPQVFYR
jgi:hypothetical protein